MMVISLWQPYASLIFAKVKNYETRSFRFPEKYRGQQIAIHATAKFTPADMIGPQLHELCVSLFGEFYRKTLPRTAILGTVVLKACHDTEMHASHVSSRERLVGDWSPERFAWELDVPRRLDMPIPAKGKQGWWKVPEEHEPIFFRKAVPLEPVD